MTSLSIISDPSIFEKVYYYYDTSLFVSASSNIDEPGGLTPLVAWFLL